MANMFDENGNYNKTEWKPGDRITAGKLNKIEESLEAINNNDIERHKEADERLDALEEQNEVVEERFDELEDLVADNKSEVDTAIYEVHSKMDRLEQEMNDGIDTVEAIAHTVDDKIADADASMKAQVAEVEANLEGLHAKDEELSEQLAHIKNINILECGAKLDGVTDDSEALLSAIEFNKPIYIPFGVLYVGNPVVIENKDSFELYGNATISVKKNIKAILIKNSSNIKIYNLCFDGLNQKNSPHDDNQILELNNCNNVKIYDNKFVNGSIGIKFDSVSELEYFNNKHTGFTGWGVNFNNIKNVNIYNNLSYDIDYDGLKGSGTFENVNVYNNRCYDNGRDGFDFAGHSCKKLRVYSNSFYNNGIDGIEIKTLNRDEYPLPEGITPVFQEIEIHNNILTDNHQTQINIANINSDTITSYNILVKNNNIKTFENYDANKHGIRIAKLLNGSSEDCIIENNTMDTKGCAKGVRCISSKNMKIRNNKIVTRGACIETENQDLGAVSGVLIENNNLKSTDGNCVNVKSDSHDTIVRFNVCLSPSTQYRVYDSGTDSIVYSNYVNVDISDISQLPRGTKGDIVYSSDMLISGCQGWVKTQTGTTVSHWKKFGIIE